jgi:hypothetical protein
MADDEIDAALHALEIASDSDDEAKVGPPAGEFQNRPPPAPRHRRGVAANAFDREADGVLPADGLAWATAPHPLAAPRLLTVDDPRAPSPPGFKGELYAPQQTLLAAMLAVERGPTVALEDPWGAAWAPRAQTRVARVSERFSAGKTVMALALVCAARAPAITPSLAPIATYPLHGTRETHVNRAVVNTGVSFGGMPCGFVPEVTARYASYLPLTVVGAASSVISHWEANAKKFTDLRMHIIENVHSLRAFEARVRRGGTADLDLVLVKAGRVTTSFVVAGEPPLHGAPKSKNRSLFGALARVLEGLPVARLIVDDYDTLKLAGDDCFVPALFTWLISATRRQTMAKIALQARFRTAAEYFAANLSTGPCVPLLATAHDDVVNRIFTLHCDPAYLDAHLNACRVDFRRVFVRGGRAAAMLRDLNVPVEVVEMLNADAPRAAAVALGVDAQGPADLLRRVMGDHLGALRHALRTLARIARARAALRGAGATADSARDLRAELKDGSDDSVDETLLAAPGGKAADAALKSLEEWATAARQKHDQLLSRMRDNIREGHCQVCTVPFGDADDPVAAYVMTSCCQIIVCERCIARRATPGAALTYITRCPNCARDVRPATDFVRVGGERDLEAALDDTALLECKADDDVDPFAADAPADTSAPGAGEPPAPAAGAAPAAAPPANPKFDALVQLIRGEPIACLRDVLTLPYVTGLLDGRRDAPWPAGRPWKILVFAVIPETYAQLKVALDQRGIRHCSLRGTRAQKDEAVRVLRDDPAVGVMLVASPKDCGGLDLPFLSHVVFYHRVMDRNVEAQVAARGQRLGRTHNLQIVTLINEGELEGL